MALDDEYIATRDNPTQLAEDVEQEVDVTVKSELVGMKDAINEMLDALSLDPKLPAEEYKIQGMANDKVREMMKPILSVIDTRLKRS